MKYSNIIAAARDALNPRKLPGGDAGDVAAALVTKDGNLYTGVCIDVSSGIGFCAEHSAVAAMITAGESEITAIVAVWGEDTILPPCGRCRELLNQVHENNLDNTDVIIQINRAVKLRELLPLPYQETWSTDEPI